MHAWAVVRFLNDLRTDREHFFHVVGIFSCRLHNGAVIAFKNSFHQFWHACGIWSTKVKIGGVNMGLSVSRNTFVTFFGSSIYYYVLARFAGKTYMTKLFTFIRSVVCDPSPSPFQYLSSLSCGFSPVCVHCKDIFI